MPFSGSVNRKVSLHRGISGSLSTLSGTLNKKVWVGLSGTLGVLNGTLNGTFSITKGMSGTLEGLFGTAGGVLLAKRSVSGTLTPAGAVSRKLLAYRSTSGVLDFTGAVMDNLLETFQKGVSGTLSTFVGVAAWVYYEGGPIARQ